MSIDNEPLNTVLHYIKQTGHENYTKYIHHLFDTGHGFFTGAKLFSVFFYKLERDEYERLKRNHSTDVK